MKHLKKFEGLIKKDDIRILNHTLLPLSNAIEEMVKTLSELENINNTPIACKYKKYFSTGFNKSINIKISYNVHNENNSMIGHLLTITLSSNNDNTYSMLINVSNNDTGDRSKRLEIEDRLREFMKKYVSRSNYLYAGGKNEFTENDINDIIDEFKKIKSELQLEIIRNKYNM